MRLTSWAVASVVTIICVACGERRETSYADLATAEQAGAIRQGWVPNWVPRSARDIRELHDLDTNQSMLSFYYDPGERLAIPSSCSPVRQSDAPSAPFRASWWPNDVPPSSLVTNRHAFFSCETDRGLAFWPFRALRGRHTIGGAEAG
jgi:hypothetical protein